MNSQFHGNYSVTISQFKLYVTVFQCMSKHSETIHCVRSCWINYLPASFWAQLKRYIVTNSPAMFISHRAVVISAMLGKCHDSCLTNDYQSECGCSKCIVLKVSWYLMARVCPPCDTTDVKHITK